MASETSWLLVLAAPELIEQSRPAGPVVSSVIVTLAAIGPYYLRSKDIRSTNPSTYALQLPAASRTKTLRMLLPSLAPPVSTNSSSVMVTVWVVLEDTAAPSTRVP